MLELFVVPSVPAVSAVLSSDQSNTREERCCPTAAPPVYVTLRVPPLILKEGLLGSSSEAIIQYKTQGFLSVLLCLSLMLFFS